MTHHDPSAVDLAARLLLLGRGDINMAAHDAWLLLACVQLCWRHPALDAEFKERLWDLGHRLQRVVLSADPHVYALANLGWDPRCDAEFTPMGAGAPT